MSPGCRGDAGSGHRRSTCHDSAWSRYARRRAFRGASNGGWGAIRGHLTGKQRVRRAVLRGYFLRRYPFRISSTPYYGRTSGALVADLDLPAGGGVVLFDAASGEAAPAVPGPIERLNRGMARFHYAAYAEASRDFDAALGARPELHGARIGRALCSIIAGRLDRAVSDLDRLARAGELQRADRLATGEVFGRPGAFEALLAGLRLRLDLRPHDADTNLLTAWTLIATGQSEEAGIHLQRAAATHGEGAVWQALRGEPRAETPAQTPATSPAGVPPSRGVRAPAPLPPIVADRSQPS